MTEPEVAEEQTGRSGRGALGLAAVLLAVLALLVLGAREEIGRAFGLSGEQGTLAVEQCGRPVVVEEQRSVCTGVFTPDDGGEPYAVEALLSADPGDTIAVGADGSDEPAYRSDAWGRLAVVALPLLPLGLLWLVPGGWLVLRTPGPLSRGQKVAFLALSVVPSALLLAVGAVGFLVAVSIS